MQSERSRIGFMMSGTSLTDAPSKSLPNSFPGTSTGIPYRSLLLPTITQNCSALSPSTFLICLHLITFHHGSLLSMFMRPFAAKASDVALFVISSTLPRHTELVLSTSGHLASLNFTSGAAGPNLHPRLTVPNRSNSCTSRMNKARNHALQPMAMARRCKGKPGSRQSATVAPLWRRRDRALRVWVYPKSTSLGAREGDVRIG